MLKNSCCFFNRLILFGTLFYSVRDVTEQIFYFAYDKDNFLSVYNAETNDLITTYTLLTLLDVVFYQYDQEKEDLLTFIKRQISENIERSLSFFSKSLNKDLEEDKKLFAELDRLNQLGVKWAMSNVLQSKGKQNSHIKEWADKNGYEIIYLTEKEYSSLGKGNAQAEEVLIINYESPFKKFNIFDFLG